MRIPLICSLALIAGCARGTTLPEATDRLESDSHGVLTEGATRLGTPASRTRVLFDARRPCGGGRARRVWRGSAPLPTGPDRGSVLDRAADVAVGLGSARGYRLDGPPAFAHGSRTFTMTHDGSDVRLTVRLRGGRHGTMRVDAATPCLPGG